MVRFQAAIFFPRQALRSLSVSKRREFAGRHLGRDVEVLFEHQDESGLWTGLTDNYLRVGVVSPEPLSNQFRRVTIQEVTDELAVGTVRPAAA